MLVHLNQLVRNGLFWLLVFVVQVAATLLGRYTSTWHGLVVVGFAAAMMLTFMLALESIYWLYAVMYAAVLVIFGNFGYKHGQFVQLHHATALYAMSAFLVAYIVFGELQNLTTRRFTIRLSRLAWLSSIAVAGFVPVVYGTGIGPMVFVIAYIVLVSLWVTAELLSAKKLQHPAFNVFLIGAMALVLVVVYGADHDWASSLIAGVGVSTLLAWTNDYAKLSLRTA